MAENDVVVAAPTPDEIIAAQAVLARVAHVAAVATVAAVAPIVTVEPPPAKPPRMAFRAWIATKRAAISTFWSTWGLASWVGRALKGLRTLLFFGVSGAGALYSSIEGIDLSGVAGRFTGLNIDNTDLLLGMSVVGFGLRLITDSSAFKRWGKAARGDGVAPGVGSGDVDEPESIAE